MKWNSKKIWMLIWVVLVTLAFTIIAFVGIIKGFNGVEKPIPVINLSEGVKPKRVVKVEMEHVQQYSVISGNALEIVYNKSTNLDTVIYILTPEKEVKVFPTFLTIRTKEWKKIIPYYTVTEVIVY